MDEAWHQVGAVLKANRDAALAQLAMATSKAMHAKHHRVPANRTIVTDDQ